MLTSHETSTGPEDGVFSTIRRAVSMDEEDASQERLKDPHRIIVPELHRVARTLRPVVDGKLPQQDIGQGTQANKAYRRKCRCLYDRGLGLSTTTGRAIALAAHRRACQHTRRDTTRGAQVQSWSSFCLSMAAQSMASAPCAWWTKTHPPRDVPTVRTKAHSVSLPVRHPLPSTLPFAPWSPSSGSGASR